MSEAEQASPGSSQVQGTPPIVWPSHFPPCCPPADARDLNDTVYYFVRALPANAEDMRSALERGAFEGQDVCQRAALSCFLEQGHAVAVGKNAPRLRKRLVAAATFTAVHGKIKRTGMTVGHHSMWLRAEVVAAPEKFFKEVS